MELFLGIGQLAVALAVAVFTWKLAIYTRELVKVQEASNRVLERQAKIQEAQQRLLELLETRPWLVLGKRSAPGAGIFELYLSNAGRAGAVVYDALRFTSEPERPRKDAGTPLTLENLTLPLALPPGETVVLVRGNSTKVEEATGKGWLEVRYRALSAEAPLLSDLWRLEGGRFVLEWAGEAVGEG